MKLPEKPGSMKQWNIAFELLQGCITTLRVNGNSRLQAEATSPDEVSRAVDEEDARSDTSDSEELMRIIRISIDR